MFRATALATSANLAIVLSLARVIIAGCWAQRPGDHPKADEVAFLLNKMDSMAAMKAVTVDELASKMEV